MKWHEQARRRTKLSYLTASRLHARVEAGAKAFVSSYVSCILEEEAPSGLSRWSESHAIRSIPIRPPRRGKRRGRNANCPSETANPRVHAARATTRWRPRALWATARRIPSCPPARLWCAASVSTIAACSTAVSAASACCPAIPISARLWAAASVSAASARLWRATPTGFWRATAASRLSTEPADLWRSHPTGVWHATSGLSTDAARL